MPFHIPSCLIVLPKATSGSRLPSFVGELVRYFVTMWCRYPDIDQASEHHINKINTTVRSEGSDAEFVVLEKVDGSNFAFVTDGNTVTYFPRKRSGLQGLPKVWSYTASTLAIGMVMRGNNQ